jgi:hypothetical protein
MLRCVCRGVQGPLLDDKLGGIIKKKQTRYSIYNANYCVVLFLQSAPTIHICASLVASSWREYQER